MTIFQAVLRPLLMLLLLAGAVPCLQAQTIGTSAIVATPPQPAWRELSEDRQQILSPLAEDWDNMENYRRKKWLGIADRYPAMGEEEQARVQRRMRSWAEMTPLQRREAREKYKNLKQLPPERKEAVKQKWEEYSNLSEEQRLQLKEAGSNRPVPTGMAPGLTGLTSLPTRRTFTPLIRQQPAPSLYQRRHPTPPGLSDARERLQEGGTPAHLRLPLPVRTLREGQMPSVLPLLPTRRVKPSAKKP